MKSDYLNKIVNNFKFSIKNYDSDSASKYWKKSISKKKNLFNSKNLKNFRNNGLADNIDDFYINKKKSENLFKNLRKKCGDKFILNLLEKKNFGNAKKIFKFKNKFFSPTDLFIIKYIYELNKKINFKKINVICEIGQGFGLLASKLLKINKFKVILIDLPESNLITAFYLKSIYPKKKIVMDIDLKNKKLNSHDLKKGDIFIISPWIKYDKISTDLFINSRSMMEMNKVSINKYFNLIQKNISKKGYFLCINRYYKDLVGYPVEFHLYPFDNYWNVVVSKSSWMQPFIHLLLVKRSIKKSEEIKIALKNVKKKYIQLLKTEKIFIRKYLPIWIYRYYKFFKNIFQSLNV